MAAKATSRTRKSGAKRSHRGRTERKGEKWTWSDFLRTPILASVGVFSIAEEGIEKFVREIIERGEATEKEGKKIVDQFKKSAQRNRRDLEKGIDARIQRTLRSFRVPTKADVDAVERKIDQLERKIGLLTRRTSKTRKPAKKAKPAK